MELMTFGIVFLRIFEHWNTPPTPPFEREGIKGVSSMACKGMFMNELMTLELCSCAFSGTGTHPQPPLFQREGDKGGAFQFPQRDLYV